MPHADTNAVTFTQFIFPNGRPEPVTIQRPDAICFKADKLSKVGVVLEIENNNGQVWLTAIRRSSGDETAVDEFCPNGPKVPLAVDKLIERAYTKFCNGGN